MYLSGIYYCPHHVDGVIPELTIRCDCRKPRPGLLLRAAAELHLDLRCSWFVGDILDDIEAGNRAGCRTILVDLGTEQLPTAIRRCPTFVARDSCHALRMIQAIESLDAELELTYRPARWLHSIAAETEFTAVQPRAVQSQTTRSRSARSLPDCEGDNREEYAMEEDSCHIL